jgi:hypothetical protein
MARICFRFEPSTSIKLKKHFGFGYAKYVEAAKNAAQANSQFVLDPTTGRLIPVKVAVAQTANQPKMLQAGYNPVTGKPLTEQETSRAANAKVELDQSHKELYDAQQAQALAKADLDKAANDPNSPLYQLKLKQYEMTQKRFQLATERVNLAYRNFGVNTYGIDFGNNSALQSGAAAGAPSGHAAAPGASTTSGSNPATNAPHGVPQGNDNQTLAPNGPAIKAARQSMASGEDHKAVLAFNTASGHLSQLQDAIDALNNNDITVLNKIANKYGVATGQSAPVVFDAIRNAVAGELGKVFKGQVTDSEVEHIGSTLGNDLSPQALSGVVKADANLMMSKLSAVHDSYYGLVGEHPYVLFPEGAAAFKKLGVELPQWAQASSTPTSSRGIYADNNSRIRCALGRSGTCHNSSPPSPRSFSTDGANVRLANRTSFRKRIVSGDDALATPSASRLNP